MDRILLGVNNENEIVFGEFELRNWNGYPEFSASFDGVIPFTLESRDLYSALEDIIDTLDDSSKLNWCNEYDCSPYRLADTMTEWLSDDELADLLYDMSLYPNTIYVDGEEWRFESSTCGQYDTTNEMKHIFCPDVYDNLMYLWKNYHLKELNEENPDYKIYERLCTDAEYWCNPLKVETIIGNYITDHKGDF